MTGPIFSGFSLRRLKRQPPERYIKPMNDSRRLLLVADEQSLAKLVTKRLEAEGFEVSVALDGEEALQKARQELPELIILDVMLPKMTGHEVCQILKQDPRYRHIPIILFTALAQMR